MKMKFPLKAASMVAYSVAAFIAIVIFTSTISQAQTTETIKTDKQQKEENYDNLPFMQTKESQTESSSPSAFGLMIRTVGALLLIVGLIVFAGWGLRKFGARFGVGNSNDGTKLTVLSTVPLGSNRSLAVVRFGERTLLIGSTPQSFALLATEDENYSGDNHSVRSVSELLSNEDCFGDELLNAQSRVNANSKILFEGERAS